MIFLCLHCNQFFSLLLQEVTTIFLVIPMYLGHLNHQRMWLVWRQMRCYFHLIFYLAMQEEALYQMRILLLLWGHLCCSIFWFDGSLTLNIKICRWRAAVADICWYWWARYFCIVKKCHLIFCIEGIWSIYHWYCLCAFFIEDFIKGMNTRFAACILSCEKL